MVKLNRLLVAMSDSVRRQVREECRGFERSQENKVGLNDLQVLEFFLSKLDVGSKLLDYLDSVLARHLEVQKAQADWLN